MGNQKSTPFEATTSFSPSQLERLRKKFRDMSGGKEEIEVENFQKELIEFHPTLTFQIFQYLKSFPSRSSNGVTLDQFQRGLQGAVKGDFFSTYCSMLLGKPVPEKISREQVLQIIYRSLLQFHWFMHTSKEDSTESQEQDDNAQLEFVNSIANSYFSSISDSQELTFASFKDWKEETLKTLDDHLLFLIWQTFLGFEGWDAKKFSTPKSPLKEPLNPLPSLEQESSIVENSHMGLLNCMIPPQAFGPDWKLLFHWKLHGFSLNRLMNQVFGFRYPVLFLIRDDLKNVFGAFTTSQLELSASFYGSSETFLFSFSPFSVLRTSGISKNFIYTSNKAPKNSENQTVGIGFGGQIGYFRLFISEDLQSGYAKDYCTTFKKGKLREATSTEFKIEAIEVWGIAWEDALKMQAQAKRYQEQMILKSRQINRQRMFGQEERSIDMKILELAGVHKSHAESSHFET